MRLGRNSYIRFTASMLLANKLLISQHPCDPLSYSISSVIKRTRSITRQSHYLDWLDTNKRPYLLVIASTDRTNTIAFVVMEPLGGEAEANLVRQNEPKPIPQNAIFLDLTSNEDGNLEESRSTMPKLTPIMGRVSRAKKGVPVHICDVCEPSKTFTRAEHLRRHQLSHEPAPYGCKYPGCEKIFHRQDLLARHTMRHEKDSDKVPAYRSYPDGPIPHPLEVDLTAPETQPPLQSSDGFSDSHTDSGYGSLAGFRSIPLDSAVIDTSISDRGSYAPFSDVPSFGHGRLEKFMREIAEEIAAGLPRSISTNLLPDLATILPELLTAFASRFGHMNTSKIDSRLMRLVYRYRFQISNSVISAFEKEDDNSLAMDQPLHSSSMALSEKMSFWKSKESYDNDGIGDFDYLPELQEYRNVMLNSPAYSWLMSAILKTLQFETAKGESIQQPILAVLKDTNEDAIEQIWRIYFVTFRTPRLSLDRLESVQALPQTIILVGKENNAFATTCGEYSRLVWPESGPQILNSFASVGQENIGNTYTCRLFDDSKVTVTILEEQDIMEVVVIGSIYSIAEVGEQLAWLTTALKLSHCFSEQLNITSNKPSWVKLADTLPMTASTPRNIVSCEDITTASFVLTSSLQDYIPTTCYMCDYKPSQGKCWSSLFGQLTLVKGYPVPRRVEPETGIEIPLPMIAALANAHKVKTFLGKFLIKGFSMALIPTRRCGEFIYWHVVSNGNGDHLEFTDHRVKQLLRQYPSVLTLGDLELSRHIVGWCANAKSNTGTPSANYSIRWSGLGPPTAGLALEKISIVGGMFITGGASMLVGKKDKAVQLRSRDDYTMRLKWVSKKFVVLYDVRDRRAWLVDGLSALLHLLRASLNYDLQDPFKSLFLYNPLDLKEAIGVEAGRDSAIQILTNPENIRIPLYAKPENTKDEITTDNAGVQTRILSRTKSNYCLKDRVDSLCDVLEQIMAYQTDMADQDGVGFKMRFTPRRHLEGFDFMDIATNEDPIRPRMINLRSSGTGWVDFTRALHTITLFGDGFGELIQPLASESSTQQFCNSCVGVSKGKDHLAVSVCNIREILQKRGSTNTVPWRLIDNIYWHSPEKSFEPCCSTLQSNTKHDRVQVLLPATFPKLWNGNLKSPPNLELAPMGAVIFGHSSRFPLRWGDRGDPEEGQLDQEPEMSESSINDSGIGSSLTSPVQGVSDSSSSRSFRSPLQGAIATLEGRVSEKEKPKDMRRLWKPLFGVRNSLRLYLKQLDGPLPNEAPGLQESKFRGLTPPWKKRKSQ
ncbi:hypothetical protein F4679DRAFT_561798 [Xylaria curta]|nr:hypothetical protein F4679DRAFT_561798 [Xylaria curta]